MARAGSTGMYVDTLINTSTYVRAFCDSGCLCYALVSERFAAREGLFQIDIRPRALEQVVEGARKPQISRIATFTADLEGFEMPVAAYVVPGQTDDVILGKGWMKKMNVTLGLKDETLSMQLPYGREIKFSTKRTPTQRLQEINAAGVTAWRVRMQREDAKTSGIHIFAVTLQDVQKALQQKQHRDPREHAPEWLMPVIDSFDRAAADRLAPHRPGLDHGIDLLDGKEPPAAPLYTMSKDALLVLRKTLTELLDKGFIRASSSPAGAPVIFVRKPGGGLRFCVDYRGLNAITRRDKYPLPLINETLRLIAQSKWISKVDVIQAFHKIRIKPGDEWKTTFQTRLGAYEWLVTPFGLCGAPATFQRYINWVLEKELDLTCSAYLDDVVIFSNGTRDEHREIVRRIVAKLGKAGLQLDFDKSEFEVSETRYLGFIIRPGHGIAVDPAKTKALREWKVPTTVRGIRGFLGFANFYRTFVKGYSQTCAPLTALTKKDVPFKWDDACQSAFDALKSSLLNAPVLANWRPEAPTTVEADSSGYVIGAALSQQQEDGLWKPVAFMSKKLSASEANWPIHDKEMYAILSAVREWKAELASTAFTVYTDHKNLSFFRKKQKLNERQCRWAIELEEFDCTLVHRPGTRQVLSDALSRRDQDLPKGADDIRLKSREQQLLQSNDDGNLRLYKDSGLSEVASDNSDETLQARPAWAAHADDDDECGNVTGEERAQPPMCPFQDDSKLATLWAEGLDKNGRYWKIRHAVRTGQRSFPSAWRLAISISECEVDAVGRLMWRGRVWIPAYEPLRTMLVQKIHDSALAGHPGRDGLRELISREYTWPNLSNDVRRFVRNCHVCRSATAWREQRQGLLKPLPVPDRPWQELSMDFITELPPSNGMKNLFVVTDRLTKACILEPMNRIDAESVANTLLTAVFRHHHLPRAIVSDRGPQFTSQVWKAVCEKVGITRRLSTAFHPETNGATERMNSEVERYLRIFCCYSQADWAALLPVAMMCLNNRRSTSTTMSPFYLQHGFHGKVLDEGEVIQATTADDAPARSPSELGEQLAHRWQEAAALAQVAMAAAQETQETQANKNRRTHERLKPGDWVWLRAKNVSTMRPSKKLDWMALRYKVLDTVDTHNYRLNTPKGIHDVFHINLLKRDPDDPLPSQRQHFNEPGPLRINNDDEWEIDEIVGHRKRKGKSWDLLVRWKGYQKPTREPLSEFLDTAALATYERAAHRPWMEEGADVMG